MAKRILVTRPEAQSELLLQALMEQGDMPIALPLLAIDPIDSSAHAIRKQAVIDKVVALANYQHVIFISTNAVQSAWYWIDKYWPQLPVQQTWYAVGQATATEIQKLHLNVEQAGVAMNSESLLSHAQLQDLDNQKVLIMRGVGGREHLKTVLEQRGAQVDYCEVYQRQGVCYEKGVFANILASGVDFLTATSAETIQRLLDQAMMDEKQGETLQIPLVVPGQRLVDVAGKLGFAHIIKAENAGLQAMLKALKQKKQ